MSGLPLTFPVYTKFKVKWLMHTLVFLKKCTVNYIEISLLLSTIIS